LDTIEQDFSSLCKGIGSELKHLSRQVSAGLQLEEERSNEYKAQTANLQEFISHVTLQSQASENARKMLERLSQQAEKERKTTEILKSLTFSQMQLKVGKIEEAHERTFTWIFDGDSSPFREWLARGTGVFWVNGNPVKRQPSYRAGQVTVNVFRRASTSLTMARPSKDPSKDFCKASSSTFSDKSLCLSLRSRRIGGSRIDSIFTIPGLSRHYVKRYILSLKETHRQDFVSSSTDLTNLPPTRARPFALGPGKLQKIIAYTSLPRASSN
jgi:hypothetical protein